MRKKWSKWILGLVLIGGMIFVVGQHSQTKSKVNEKEIQAYNLANENKLPLTHEQEVAKCLEFLGYSYQITCNPISQLYEKCKISMRKQVRECLILVGMDDSEEAISYFRFPFGRYFCDWLEEQSKSPSEDESGKKAFNNELNHSCPMSSDVIKEDSIFCEFLKIKIDYEKKIDEKKELENQYRDQCMNN